jgi:ABC-type transport system involved in cytochrome bd biosynthesis fused ATPase/permease subunit
MTAGPAVVAAQAFLLAEARAAAFSVVSALRLALIAGIAVSNPPGMFQAGTTWSTEVATEFGALKSKVEDALDKAKEGWTAEDYDALETKLKEEVLKHLDTVQSSAGLIGGGMFGVAGAYLTFWAFAAQVIHVAAVAALAAWAARPTPAGPATQAAAEAAVNALATALDGVAKKLATLGTATAVTFGAVALALGSGVAFNPVGKKTADLKQVQINWTPPSQWVAPKKEDPVPYDQANNP